MIQVKWVQVQNFRSISDTGRIFLDPNITLFAGKNESGKTNILKALECFSNDEFNEEDIPIDVENGEKLEPTVTVNFEVDKKILSKVSKIPEIFQDIGVFECEVTRTRSNSQVVKGTAVMALIKDEFNSFREKLYSLNTVILHNGLLDEDSKILFIEAYNDVRSEYDKQLFEDFCNTIKDLLHNEKLDEAFVKDIIEIVNDHVNELEKNISNIDRIIDNMNKIIPSFILFDSFNDMLPDSINLGSETPNIISNFYKLVNITDTEELFNAKGQARKRLVDKISATISGDFGSFYSQNEVKLTVDIDGDELYFYIYDHDGDTPFRPQQRSKGFQWFLSFFLTLSAHENKNYVLLIDEPGLYLHAKAQDDILNILEKISKEKQILVTTHSPYLLNSDRLERIRLVSRGSSQRTYVENKIHKGADIETLTPVITAIGLDLTKSLPFNPNFNILVEGISDYYYLEAMKRYLYDNLPNLNTQIIPCVGATKIPIMASLLFGWGLPFKVLLDKDKEGEQTKRNLINKHYLDNDEVIFVGESNPTCIEDLFSSEDFINYILLDSDLDISSNTEYIKKQKLDKVLLSKKFNESIQIGNQHLTLSSETISNFIDLFGKLYKNIDQSSLEHETIQ